MKNKPLPRSCSFLAGAVLLLLAAIAGCSKEENEAAPSRAVRVVLVSPAQVFLGFRGTTDIAARVSHIDDGSPAAGVTVKFAMEGEAAGASLSASEAISDADGRATAALTSGTSMASFSVSATPVQREGVTVEAALGTVSASITTDGIARGKLRVSYSFGGASLIEKLDTRVYSDVQQLYGTCSQVMGSSLPGGLSLHQQVVNAAPGTSVVPVAQTLEHKSFLAGAALSVVAAGYGSASTKPLAVGCIDAPALKANSTTEASIVLTPVD